MPPATYITTNFASLVHLFNSNVLLIRLIKQNSTRYLRVSESSQSEIRIYLRNFPLDKKVYDIRCLMFSFFLQFYKNGKKQFSVSWNVFLLAFFSSFDGFGGKMKMTAINDFVLATHFLQANVEDSSHCLSSACLRYTYYRNFNIQKVFTNSLILWVS